MSTYEKQQEKNVNLSPIISKNFTPIKSLPEKFQILDYLKPSILLSHQQSFLERPRNYIVPKLLKIVNKLFTITFHIK
jgi:hypothetical protein